MRGLLPDPSVANLRRSLQVTCCGVLPSHVSCSDYLGILNTGVCRLGVTHNICEAIPEQCGPDMDQVMVFGGPVENKYVADTHTPESMAYMLHHFFKQYINNSEAASMSWVAKRACTEKKGASLIMVAVHHVDMGEDAVLPGDIIYHPELGSLQV